MVVRLVDGQGQDTPVRHAGQAEGLGRAELPDHDDGRDPATAGRGYRGEELRAAPLGRQLPAARGDRTGAQLGLRLQDDRLRLGEVKPHTRGLLHRHGKLDTSQRGGVSVVHSRISATAVGQHQAVDRIVSARALTETAQRCFGWSSSCRRPVLRVVRRGEHRDPDGASGATRSRRSRWQQNDRGHDDDNKPWADRGSRQSRGYGAAWRRCGPCVGARSLPTPAVPAH